MASTKQKIAEAAKKRFKTKEIQLVGDAQPGEEVIVTVREISPAAMRALKEKLWQRDGDGKFIVVDKDDNPVTTGEGWYRAMPDVNHDREWLLAAMLPTDAVEEIMSEDVPGSVRDEIVAEAKAINGLRSFAIIAKNS
jgi:hypothetical protein